MADKETKQDTRAQYGFGQQFLKAHPEIAKLVNRAVNKGYTVSRFEYELRQTQWYRKRTEAQRNWDVLVKTQPREAQERRRDKRREISMVAESLGVRLTSREMQQFTERAIKFDWSPAEMQYRVGRQFEYGERQSGAGQQAHQELTEMSMQYGVPMSKGAVEAWARQVAMGTATVDGFRDHIVEKAKGKYRGIASDLDRGLTVDQLFDPYRQQAADLLGVNPNSIAITDRKYQDVFSYMPKGAKESRPMTLDEFSRALRTQKRYGFDGTDQAQEMARKLASAIQENFGQRG
jgi:hypothetical protein